MCLIESHFSCSNINAKCSNANEIEHEFCNDEKKDNPAVCATFHGENFGWNVQAFHILTARYMTHQITWQIYTQSESNSSNWITLWTFILCFLSRFFYRVNVSYWIRQDEPTNKESHEPFRQFYSRKIKLIIFMFWNVVISMRIWNGRRRNRRKESQSKISYDVYPSLMSICAVGIFTEPNVVDCGWRWRETKTNSTNQTSKLN